MFSLNSVTKIKLFSKDCWAQTHYLLCEKQGLYHYATDTSDREDSFNYSNSCFSDLSDSLNSLNSVKILLYLGKNPIISLLAQEKQLIHDFGDRWIFSQ